MKRLLLSFALLTLLLSPGNLYADRQVDQLILNEVQRLLGQAAKQGKLSGYKLEMEVAGGEVVLAGYVSTADQQALVINVARRVSGVMLVTNKVVVRQTHSAPESSAASFSLTDWTSEEESVPGSQFHMPETGSVALNSPGNNSTAAPASVPKPFDEQIAESIIQRVLDQQAEGTLRGYKFYMQVVSGTVSLKGHVANEQQKAMVLDIASRTPGAKRVVNGLTIKRSSLIRD